MSKLSTTLLALLTVLAMLFMWSGTATADDPPQTLEECLAAATDPASCVPLAEERLTRDEEQDDTGGDGEGEATGGDESGGGESGGGDEGADTERGSVVVQEEDPPTCDDLPETPLPLCELPTCDDLPFCEEEQPPARDPAGGQHGGTPVGNQDPYYENCDDARAQGAAPVYAGQPGYGRHLDADDDGIGCEEDAVVPVTHHTGGLAYTGTEIAPQLKAGVLLLIGSGLLLAARRRA